MGELNGHRGLHAAVRCVAAAAVVAAALWAVLPGGGELAPFDVDAAIAVPEGTEALENDRRVSIDPAVFDVTLWYTPPEPPRPAPEPVPTPPARVTIELLGISTVMTEDGEPVPVAVVYDTEGDTVQTLKVGAVYKGQTIAAIVGGVVTVRVGSRSVDLELESGEER